MFFSASYIRLKHMLNNFFENQSRIISAQSLAIFRIVTGVLIVFEGFRLLKYREFYFEFPEVLFKWDLLHWIPKFPEPVILVLAILLMLFGVFVLVGLKYRVAIITSLVIYAYFFFVTASYYNSHAYLFMLVLFLMSFNDADNFLSIKQKHKNNNFFNDQGIPIWQLNAIAAQIIIVLFYSGIAKLNLDWLSGETVKSIVQSNSSDVFNKLFNNTLAHLVITYFSLIYFLLIGWFLINKKFKLVGVILIVFVQLVNLFFIKNGITTYILLGSVVIFLRPDIIDWVKSTIQKPKFLFDKATYTSLFSNDESNKIAQNKVDISQLMRSFIIVFFALQMFLPIRHYLIKGNVDYTGEGLMFSWRMNSFYKSMVMFKVLVKDEATGKTYNCPLQINTLQSFYLLYQPSSLKYLAEYIAENRFPNIEKEDLYISFFLASRLNTHTAGFLIDYESNLLEQKNKYFSHNKWINTEISPIEGGRWNWIKKKPVHY